MTAPGWDVTGYYAVQLLPEQAPAESGGRLAEPGIIEPRPLTVGDVLGGAFRAVRYAPLTMFGLTLVVVLVAQLVAVGAGYLIDRQFAPILPQDDLGGVTSMFGWSSLTSTLATMLATIVVEIGLSFAVHEAVFARRTTPSAALRRLGSRAGAAIAFATLTGLAGVVAIGLLVFGAGMLAEAVGEDGWLILVVLVPAFLVAAIWISIRLLLAPCAIAIEKAGPIQAIRRSWRLSKGQFWRILGIYLLASILISMAASTVSSVFSFVILLIGMANMEVGLIAATVVSTVISAVLSVPLTAAVVTLLYVDARIRGEGYELQLAEALYG
ncbi:MAG TPA: glycerophosphoryl diester phosphodiesterase membrane domain-containing protein [Propionicimonas sp.]|nr:glycerophosphoryl diester phosphodiesterase membrane domain-containing protein [Propionicimonas sp.]